MPLSRITNHPSGFAGKTTDIRMQVTGAVNQAKNSDKAEKSGFVARSGDASGQFRQINVGYAAQAQNIRKADQTLEAVANAMQQMRQGLETVVKNYPPYPPGSEERKDVLTNYAALRKQIEQMTIPPEQDPASVVDEQEAVSAPPIQTEDQWDVVFDENGRIRTVNRLAQLVSAGLGDSMISDLGQEASDLAIYEAIDKLRMAEVDVYQQREALHEDVRTLAVEQDGRLSSVFGEEMVGNISEEAAKQISIELGQRLANAQNYGSLTSARRELLGLIG